MIHAANHANVCTSTASCPRTAIVPCTLSAGTLAPAARAACTAVSDTSNSTWVSLVADSSRLARFTASPMTVYSIRRSAPISPATTVPVLMPMPAISSGIFGFPKELCAEILVDAAVDYFAQNPSSGVRELRFTNIDGPTVGVFLEEFRRRFGAG